MVSSVEMVLMVSSDKFGKVLFYCVVLLVVLLILFVML